MSDILNFKLRCSEIQQALYGSTGIVQSVCEENKEDIFYMLLFCLCVPQSKAVKVQQSIDELREVDFYNQYIPFNQLIEILKPNVRFCLMKAHRLVIIKNTFVLLWPVLLDAYQQYQRGLCDLKQIRDYLVNQIEGCGHKVAGHFLRNIGLRGLCILDTHVLDGMVKRKLIDRKPKSLTAKKYCEIENKMIKYAESIGLNVDELDLLWWSDKTGYVFK